MIGPTCRARPRQIYSTCELPRGILQRSDPRHDDRRLRYLALAGQGCARRQLVLWRLALHAVGRARLRGGERRRLTNSAGTFVPGQDVSLGRLHSAEVGYRFAHTEDMLIEPFAAIEGVWDFDNPNVAIIDGSSSGQATSGAGSRRPHAHRRGRGGARLRLLGRRRRLRLLPLHPAGHRRRPTRLRLASARAASG